MSFLFCTASQRTLYRVDFYQIRATLLSLLEFKILCFQLSYKNKRQKIRTGMPLYPWVLNLTAYYSQFFSTLVILLELPEQQ